MIPLPPICVLCDAVAVTTAGHVRICAAHFQEYADEACQYLLRLLESDGFIGTQISAACVPPAGMPPPPPIGQAPSPPARGPALTPELPYYTRGGYVICRVCNLATPYCKGHSQAPGSVAQDGDCDSTLETRIAECQDSK